MHFNTIMERFRHIRLNSLVQTGLVLLLLSACKKENLPEGTASLTIINAVPNSKRLATNFNSNGASPYLTGRKIEYGKYFSYMNQFSAYSGDQRLRLFQYPDTTVKDQPLNDIEFNLPVNSIHTLFLTGTVNDADTVFVRDQVPFMPAGDSTTAIRFVNLSPGSNPVNVTLNGQPVGGEVVSLPYKGITVFKKFPVRLGQASYVFEFRDQVSSQLLASYTLTGIGGSSINNWLYRSFTIALLGIPGATGTAAQKTLLVQHR